jgi:hypothetical protein
MFFSSKKVDESDVEIAHGLEKLPVPAMKPSKISIETQPSIQEVDVDSEMIGRAQTPVF